MTRRANIKKLRKQFHVGDRVTWGREVSSHVVVAADDTGVTVDVSRERDAHVWGVAQPDGRFFHRVPFHSDRGVPPLRKVG